ncbi:hypothetical protein [Sphingomonas sp.]|uniref:hypothetical protein n=1 Tax=Sphingomonas sp. TaxID=28214 RepID=UPI003B00923A
MNSYDGEWLSSLDAVDQLTDKFGDLTCPTIAGCLRAGKLNVKASKAQSFFDYGHSSCTVKAPPVTVHEEMSVLLKSGLTLEHPFFVGPAMWTGSVDWDADVARWDWYKGIFVITDNIRPIPSRTRIYGIQFLRSEISASERLRPFYDVVRKLHVSASKPGRPPKIDWRAPIIQLIEEARCNDLAAAFGTSSRGRRATLTRWLSNYFDTRTGQMPEHKALSDLASEIIRVVKFPEVDDQG